MSDKENIGLPISQQKPTVLTEKQKWIASHLDILNRIDSFCPGAIPPSDLYKGALQTMLPENRKTNPDWMAQSAHSFREILYGIQFVKKITNRKVIADVLKVYQEEKRAAELASKLFSLYEVFTHIAHHLADSNREIGIRKALESLGIVADRFPIIDEQCFERLVGLLESIWIQSIPRQLNLHEQIDSIIRASPEKTNKGKLRLWLFFNPDARRYFYSKADENWLDWLWANGFLNIIRDKSEDPSRYSYQTPELDYLTKVASKLPNRVADIILSFSISPHNFNPEVIDRFLGICQKLPAIQLARIVNKIRDEKWVFLMGKFNRWGFEYEEMMEILANARDYSSLLILVEAILEVRSKESISEKDTGLIPDYPFYLIDLSKTKIFERLVEVDDAAAEQALGLITRVIRNILNLGETKKYDIFDINDNYILLNVDFFTVTMDDAMNRSYREDMIALAATIKILIQRTIGSRCNDRTAVRLLFEKYIKTLPNCQSMWRLRLFALSLCPDVFKNELRTAFFKIFDFEEPFALLRGAEYKWAVKKTFLSLSVEDQRSYVSQIFSLFCDKDMKSWKINSGWSLLSCSFNGLTDEEKERAKDIFGRDLDPNYQPEASIGKIKFGHISAKAPIDQEALSRMSILSIVDNLKKDWTPDNLRKQDKEQDIFKPLNAEGLGNLIKADISNRPKDYISNAPLFFDRYKLDPHYTYTLLMGIYELLRGKIFPDNIDWKGIIYLLIEIVDSSETQEFDHSSYERQITGTWLVAWDGVHNAAADVLQLLLEIRVDQQGIDISVYRSELLKILAYLLHYPDPEPETELKKIDEIERDPQTGAERHTGCDPYTAAINSVRGCSFQAFVSFVEKEEALKPENKAPILPPDVKELYKKCLDAEKTQAVRFLFGYYLAFFYFRDRNWIRELFPRIFLVDEEKSDLYLSAWEGYLSWSTLYSELFDVLMDYYKRAITWDPDRYSQRRYSKDLDIGLAEHFALAFVYYADFSFSSNLFKLFWETKNIKRHKEFISFIGRSCISRDKAKEWIEINSIDIDKLRAFWDWALENCSDSEVLRGFSFWIEAEQNIFDHRWLAERARLTLEKTGGEVEWDHGIIQSLPILADSAPEDTIQISRLYLAGAKGLICRRPWLPVGEELMGVFKKLYDNPTTREETIKLIEELLPLGNGQFWVLKEIVQKH